MSSSSVSLGRNLVSLKWKDFNMFVVSELAALYQKDDLTDVTLFCEGRSFRAHKVLLSLWSSYFRDVFRSTSHAHPVVIVRETNSSDLELILRFIYQGHLLIPIEETDRFLKTAEHFQVAGLKNMRLHVPNFSYPPGTTVTVTFNEETVVHQQVHSNNVPSNINEPVASKTNSGQLLTATSNLHGQQHLGGSHLRISSVAGSAVPTSAVVHPHAPQPGVTTNLGNELSHGGSLPPPSHHCPPSPVAESTYHHHHHHHPESGQQQVIRQGSSRVGKHGPGVSYSSTPSTGFQSNAGSQAVSPSSGGVGVVTRMPSESVIYQPQPVLIFQNGSSTQILKPGEQYTTRSGDTRSEHSMMVLEGVVSESSIHIEPSATSTSHLSTANSGGSAYTVYAHPSPSPVSNQNVHHHPSSEVSGEESILGLPYESESSTSRELSQHQHSSQDPPGLHLPHQHQISDMHSSTKQMEMESESVVVTHPYAPPSSASSSISYDPLANGSNGSSNSSSNYSQTPSKTKVNSPNSTSPPDIGGHVQSTAVNSAPVYAVKRIPPPLPPSNSSSTQARSFRNVTVKNDIPSSRVITTSPPAPLPPQNNSVNAISTRSKSGGSKVASSSKLGQKATSQGNPSTSTSNAVGSSSSVGVKDGRGGVTAGTSSKKVVLVQCPKCGKKVKQTSLKVHLKRTHLEEGTVLVCPICSKRISSKGVYYKHMYLHRKRSEASVKAENNSTLIKTETQGT